MHMAYLKRADDAHLQRRIGFVNVSRGSVAVTCA